jgi:hypothetical protein
MIDRIAPSRAFAADVVHGYVRRSADGEQLAELMRDCLDALKESAAGSPGLPSPGLSLRLTQ